MQNDKALQPVLPDDRVAVVDVLRGLAICGILIGNMQWFSGYGMMPPSLAGDVSQADKAVHFLVHFLVEGKFYSIFSFLFGWGFALQIERAEARGDLKASLFKRRLFWLFVIGVLHAVFLWAGDILSVYAVTGTILLLFRRKTDQGLLKWAIALIFVPVVTYALLTGLFLGFAPADALAGFEAGQLSMWQSTVQTVSHGNYYQILTEFNLQYLAGRWIGLIVQMRFPKILAMFLLGYYAYRRGYLQNIGEHRPFLKSLIVYGLIIGLAGNAAMALLAGSEAPFPPSLAGLAGVAAYAVSVPALALAIVAIVALLWLRKDPAKVLSLLAPVGRMAMTNYLLQTVICVVVFYGYGLGRYGTVRASGATALAFGIFGLQIVFSYVWLRYFAYGPMEWLWRQLTYRRRLPLIRGAAEA